MKIVKREPIDDWHMITVETPKGDCFITQWSTMTDEDVLEAADIWVHSQ